MREQESNQLLGVWYWTEQDTEGPQMYNRLFGQLGGSIDFFFSDRPLEAMQARDAIESCDRATAA